RKLPFVVRYTIWERLPYLILAAAAFTVAVPAPGLTLVLLLAMLLVIAGTGGVLMPAWMDVVAGAIPTTLRGRFFAFAGVGASLITAWLLAAVPAPRSYGLCFLLCALFMAVSYTALTSVRERPGPAGPTALSMRGQL